MYRPSMLVAILLTGLVNACSGLPDRLPSFGKRLSPPPAAVIKSIPIPASGLVDVAPGDTVFSISRRFGVDMRTLVSMNELRAPYQVAAGQKLSMPVRGTPDETTLRIAVTTKTRDTTASVPLPQPRPSNTKKVLQADRNGQLVSATRISARTSPLQPASRGGKRFLWPVRGRIISNFGPREGGLHNDGINIAAPNGVPIVAADNGVVAYAGQELRVFGNLLLIKHADGWTSAYAHAQRILVKRGDRVKRGQAIGTIGTTGSVTRPQLHFELRRGSRAVDPRGELET